MRSQANLTFRRARVDDAPRLKEIWTQRLHPSQAVWSLSDVSGSTETFAQLINLENPFGVFVAEDEENIVGYTILSPMRYSPTLRPTMAEFGASVVLSYRGRGVVSSLVDLILLGLLYSSVEFLFIYLSQGQIPSQRLAQRCGAELFGLLPAPPKTPERGGVEVWVAAVARARS